MSLILGVWREKLWIDSSGSSGLVNRGDPSSYVWKRGRMEHSTRRDGNHNADKERFGRPFEKNHGLNQGSSSQAWAVCGAPGSRHPEGSIVSF